MTAEASQAPPPPGACRTLAEALWFPAALFLGFLFCFAPALHSPTPHHTKIAVAGAKTQAIEGLQRLHPGWFDITSVPDAAQARLAVHDREAAAGLVTGDDEVLYVAGANGAVLSQKLSTVFTTLADEHGRTLTVVDVAPTAHDDPMGTSTVYLGIAWSVPGYILATTLLRATAFDRRRKFLAVLGVSAAFSIVGSSVAGALGYLPVSPSSLGIAFLLTTAVATTSLGLAPFTRQFFPAVGMGLFIVLSIPTSGGPAPAPLLPAVFQYVHTVMPLANAVDALRGIVYFGGAGTLKPSLVLCAWTAAGAVLLGVDALRHRRRDAREAAVMEPEDVPELLGDDPALHFPGPAALPAHGHHFGDREPDLVGTVYFAGRGSVPNAAVIVIDGHGRQLVRTATDEHGHYAIAGLPEGHLSVLATAAGQAPAVQRKHLRPGTVVRADFTLLAPPVPSALTVPRT
ncbi:carboxypeptidase regulatory-like domain-containing protein [Streptomyces sp. NPDC087901]|uniref:carboxypeptidase regulatory-like domain-containing protein n=1 Tax=Streptomyces sp. NPDC087901 TaxID=3365818 RepID=UPI00382B4FEF